MPTMTPSDKGLIGQNQRGHSLVVGGLGESGRRDSMDVTVDDLEIWYGTRDYVAAECLLEPCLREHYIIGEICLAYLSSLCNLVTH